MVYIILFLYFYRCSTWIELCGSRHLPILNLHTLNKTYGLYLCSLHFERNMFLNYEDKVLSADALPTLFPSKSN